MKKIFLFFLTLCISVIFSSTAFAENFYIKNYNVLINVNENNVAHIQEEIDVKFTTPSHGIFRSVPLFSELKYADGSRKKSRSIITNIKVSEMFSTTRGNNDLIIKIGNPNSLVSGEHSYTISYDYKMPITIKDGKQEFYYNIIGTKWPVRIERSSFSLHMPKPFDKNKAGLSIGAENTAGFDGSGNFNINENYIYGMYDRILNPHEGMTIRIELPEDYFIQNISDSLLNNQNSIFIALILLVIPFFIWLQQGKDERIIPVVNFNPPKGKNSAEIGALHSGAASVKEVVSLIIYLANKGYIQIQEYNDSYKLVKIKNYDGRNQEEKMLLDGIFGLNTEVLIDEMQDNTSYVTSSSHSLYNISNKIIDFLNKNICKKIYDDSAFSKGNIIIFTVSILLILTLIIYILGDYSWAFLQMLFSQGMIFILIFPIIALLVLVCGFSSTSGFTGQKLFFLIWSLMFGGIPTLILWETCIADAGSIDYTALIASIIVLISVIICFVNLRKVNYYGRRIKGEIEGFKKFIEVADKNRIESIIAQNPNYCFDILPYAYVLGVSDKWIKQFEHIFMQSPQWYVGSNSFNLHKFNSISKSINHAAIPPSSSRSSHGGFSGGGGGFSGGGHGGGGGGSW